MPRYLRASRRSWVLRDPLLPERLLARMWRMKTGATLQTTDGRDVRVVYPGRPAPGHGPDFRDAVLEIDGAQVNGPVELHRVPSDWFAHGHQRDAAYDSVVLHVVARARDSLRTDDSEGADMATLADTLPRKTAVDDLPTVVLDGDREANHALGLLGGLRGLSNDDLRARLTEAGIARFDRRVAEAAVAIERLGADQALLMRVADCLGYSENRAPFAELARRASYPLLLAAGRTVGVGVRPEHLERLLLQGAGLVPVANEWSSMIGTPPMAASVWRTAGVRPSNHPRRRVAALAWYVSKGDGAGFATWAANAANGNARAFIQKLTIADANRGALVGDSRAREIAVGAVLPLLAAMGSTAAWAMYEQFPALQDNTVTREAVALIGKRRGLRLKACQQQGLLHLYRKAVRATPGGEATHA